MFLSFQWVIQPHLLSVLGLLLCLHHYSASAQEPPALPRAQEQISTELTVQFIAPNSNWKALNTQQLRSLSNIAVAGGLHSPSMIGLVLVEPLQNISLNDYATALMENNALNELLIESVEEVEFHGQTALRLVYSGDEANGRFRYLSYIFISDSKGYQVVSGGPVSQANQNSLNVFSQGVRLSRIAKSVKPSPQVSIDEYDVTWRLQKGIFRHALSQIKVSSDSAWTVLAGQELAHINQQAIVGLRHRQDQVHLLVFDRPCPTQDIEHCQAWAQDELLQDLSLNAHDDRYEYDYLGQAQKFQRLSHERGLYTYLYNIQVRQQRVLQTLAWTLAASNEDQQDLADQVAQQWKHFPEALQHLTLMTASESADLLLELKELANPTEFMRSDASWLNDRYHHFDSGLSWQKPSGLWEVRSPESRPLSQAHLLHITVPRYDLQAQLQITHQHQLDSASAHQQVWHEMQKQLQENRGQCNQSEHGNRLINQVPSQWTRCLFSRPLSSSQGFAIEWVYQLDTFLTNGRISHLLTWAPKALFYGRSEIVREQFEAQFTIQPPASLVITQDDSIIDERFRYALKGLPEKGEFRLRANLALGKASSLFSFNHSDLNVQVFAVSHLNQKQLEQLVQQLLKSNAQTKATRLKPTQEQTQASKLERKKVWVKGLPAERLLWQEPDPTFQRGALLISMPPIVYGIVAVGDEMAVRTILSGQGFEFLP